MLFIETVPSDTRSKTASNFGYVASANKKNKLQRTIEKAKQMVLIDPRKSIDAPLMLNAICVSFITLYIIV
jgi:hypothetical protein